MNIDALRMLCLALPEVTEDIKWGQDLCFSVGGKMFCVTQADVEGATSFKADPDQFEELLAKDGINPAPYLARYHWVSVQAFAVLSDVEWEQRVRRSYALVVEKLSKKRPASSIQRIETPER